MPESVQPVNESVTRESGITTQPETQQGALQETETESETQVGGSEPSGGAATTDVQLQLPFSDSQEYVEGFVDKASGPEFLSFSPASGASNVKLDAHLFLTFSKPVKPNVGSVTVRRSSDHSIVESIFVTSLQVSGAGTTKITINLSKNLEQGAAYYVEVAAKAFVDSEGNFSSEIKGAGTWYFETVVKEEPVSEEPEPNPVVQTTSGSSLPANIEEGELSKS